MLLVCGPVPWLSLAKLFAYMSGVESLSVYGEQDKEGGALVYNPALPRVASVFLAHSSLTIRELALSRHRFSSSLDLLRLLGAIPTLRSVSLSEVAIDRPSAPAPCSRGTCLRSITATRCSAELWPLILCFGWKRHCADPGLQKYPGLRSMDAHAVQDVLQRVRFRDLYVSSFSSWVALHADDPSLTPSQLNDISLTAGGTVSGLMYALVLSSSTRATCVCASRPTLMC